MITQSPTPWQAKQGYYYRSVRDTSYGGMVSVVHATWTGVQVRTLSGAMFVMSLDSFIETYREYNP